jgi:hypothetical protein
MELGINNPAVKSSIEAVFATIGFELDEQRSREDRLMFTEEYPTFMTTHEFEVLNVSDAKGMIANECFNNPADSWVYTFPTTKDLFNRIKELASSWPSIR